MAQDGDCVLCLSEAQEKVLMMKFLACEVGG